MILSFYLFEFLGVTMRQIRVVFGFALLLGLAVPVLLGERVMNAQSGHYKRLNEPYRELVQQFPVTDNFLLITDRVRMAGNLMNHLPENVTVLSAEMPYFQSGSRNHKTVVLAWREKWTGASKKIPARLLTYATELAGEQTIEFDGRATLYAKYIHGTEQRHLYLAWFDID